MDRTDFQNGFHASVAAMEHLQNEFTDPLTAIGKFFGNGVLWIGLDDLFRPYGWYVYNGEILPITPGSYSNGGHIVEEYLSNTLSDGRVVDAQVKRKIVPIEDGESFTSDETIDVLHARRFMPTYSPNDGQASYCTVAEGLAEMEGAEVHSLPGNFVPYLQQHSPQWKFRNGAVSLRAFIKKDTGAFGRSDPFLTLQNYSFGRLMLGQGMVVTRANAVYFAPLWINYSGQVRFDEDFIDANMASDAQSLSIWGVFK